MSALPGFRDARVDDLDALMALNDAAVPHVNALTRSAWIEFLDAAAMIRLAEAQDGSIAALMVALPPGLGYGSENYSWFGRRLSQFVYVDRIVVAPAWRGCGLGAAAYADLRAASAGDERPIVCEVNLRPTNDASLAFHGKQGFREIGVQSVYGNTKRVAMLARRSDGSIEPSLPGPDDGASLRRADANDAAAIIEMTKRLLGELGAPTPMIDERNIAAALAAERLVAVIAATDAAEMVGLLVLGEGNSVHAGGSFGVITELHVARSVRGRGLGARLIAAARREAMTRGWRRLEVTTPDAQRFAATQRFYAANDFTAIGPRLRLPLG